MKPATPGLAALINGGQFQCFDLYTMNLVGGGVLRFADADIDVFLAGTTFSAAGVMLAGQRPLAHWKIGLDTDQWQITLAPRARDLAGNANPDKIGAIAYLPAAAAGALDGADVLVQRAYFARLGSIDVYGLADVYAIADVYGADPSATQTTYPIAPGGAVPVGALTIFRGRIADIEVTTTAAIVTINDARQILATQMPRNLYQAACRHRLFDSGCGLSAESFATNATALAGSTRAVVLASPGTAPGSGTWQLGRIAATGGDNAGLSRTIAKWDGASTFTLQAPFLYDFKAGDTLRIYVGCDKTMATCRKFANILNFGGEPFIPIPETTS